MFCGMGGQHEEIAMPRNISFALTTRQFRNRTKTVTRRGGWEFLEVGDVLMACEKCQGIKKGELVRLGRILVTAKRREHLSQMTSEPYGSIEARKEGFPQMTGREFIAMFCEHMNCKPSKVVTRIEFEYLD